MILFKIGLFLAGLFFIIPVWNDIKVSYEQTNTIKGFFNYLNYENLLWLSLGLMLIGLVFI